MSKRFIKEDIDTGIYTLRILEGETEENLAIELDEETIAVLDRTQKQWDIAQNALGQFVASIKALKRLPSPRRVIAKMMASHGEYSLGGVTGMGPLTSEFPNKEDE